jgi:hypothetical protein
MGSVRSSHFQGKHFYLSDTFATYQLLNSCFVGLKNGSCAFVMVGWEYKLGIYIYIYFVGLQIGSSAFLGTQIVCI